MAGKWLCRQNSSRITPRVRDRVSWVLLKPEVAPCVNKVSADPLLVGSEDSRTGWGLAYTGLSPPTHKRPVHDSYYYLTLLLARVKPAVV